MEERMKEKCYVIHKILQQASFHKLCVLNYMSVPNLAET